jgi:PAS domain S-box-containing protein
VRRPRILLLDVDPGNAVTARADLERRGYEVIDDANCACEWAGAGVSHAEPTAPAERFAQDTTAPRRGRSDLLADASIDAVITMHAAFGIRALNASAEGMFGWTEQEMLGRPLSSLLRTSTDAGERGDTWLRRASDPPACFRVTGMRKNGTSFPALLRLSEPAADDQPQVAIIRDLTASDALETELIQAEKMAALGLLAASVAHDFNNALSALRAQLYVAQAQLSDLLPLAEVHTIVDRCASLTRWLLSVSLPSTARSDRTAHVVDLRQCVTEALKGVKRLLPSSIGLAAELGQEPALVELDPSLIVHAVINLVVNARDALPGGGVIVVTLRTASDHHALTVDDAGQGMSAEVVQRAFEPFFTTKAPGLGTGLGLSSVRRIVEQANGAVAISSEPGHGTRVTLTLPRAAESVMRRIRSVTPQGAEQVDFDKLASALTSDDS